MKTSMTRYFWRLRYKLIWARFYIYKFYSDTKWILLKFYYDRLFYQAELIYRNSDLFKIRWQCFGLAFAEESYDKDSLIFFDLARKEHFKIRLQLFLDGLLNREMKSYYFSED